MPSVFLSYSREDLPRIQQLEAQLKNHPEISIWRDQESLFGGQNWPKALGEAIADQDVFLLAWSKHSAASYPVELEWTTAIAHKKTIVPYLLDETPLPAALKAFHGYHLDDVTGLITSLRSALLGDVQRRKPVIRKLSAITTTEEIAVPSQAKTAFAQQQWTVQKSQAYATLAATILTIIISIFVINEKFLATPVPPTIVAPAPEGKSELAEDPLYAMQHLEKGDGKGEPVRLDVQNDIDRVRSLRQEVDDRIAHLPGRPITILLVTTEGGSSEESRESRETRIRDRYAIGSALGVACYVPEREDRLSYIEWQDRTGVSQVVPYEWYEQGPRKCSPDQAWAQTVLIMWINGDVTGDHPISALQRLTQSILCKEGTSAACLRKNNGIVDLDGQRKKSVRFKIVGPRSSSAFRTLLEEIASAMQVWDKQLVWASTEDHVELYSPWATAMPQLLTHGITLAEPPDAPKCKSSDAEREYLCKILLWGGIELRHSIGSDDQLFESLVHELERRRVKFERDAVILISEGDSFYGRMMPVEFTARVCHRIAHRSSEENRAIPPERLARIRDNCSEIHKVINLQMDDPVGTRRMGLNLWRYSYLRGLDGEVAGGGKADATKGSGTKSVKNVFGELHERPVGTSQFDYAQRLAARIERDMAEQANWKASGMGGDEEYGTKPVAVGIFGSDASYALLMLQALRERFPGAVFFTTDLDSRLSYAEDYHWTRNLVIASHYGLELYQDLQRDVPPFHSSYQTSVYLATLQAIGYVQPMTMCLPFHGPLAEARGPLVSPCGYKANRLPEGIWFNNQELPRLFEVGRHGGVDLTVGAITEGYTLHPPRVDLSIDDPLTDGRRPGSGVVYGTAGLIYLTMLVIGWTKPTINRWLRAHLSAVVLGAAGAAIFAILIDQWFLGWVLRHHDAGEPFYWLEGVSIWPTEILRVMATLLALALLVRGWWHLRSNLESMTERYGFAVQEGPAHLERWRRYLTAGQWVLSPRRGRSDMPAGSLWQLYRDAGSWLNRLMRLLLLMGLYVGTFFLLWKVMGAEDLTGPCRGELSCHLDLVLALVSYASQAVLNLFVFDAVLLCRRWIGALDQVAEGWPAALTGHLKWQTPENLLKAREMMKIELIAQRTDVVNRLVRYPFIVLLVMMVASNSHFDNWHFPLTMLVGWAVNVLLALLGIYLLYQSAQRVKVGVLAGFKRQLGQTLGIGKDHEIRAKQIQYFIGEVEANQNGAFVPLYQQPMVETSLYGVIALMQYLHLG